MTNGPDLPTFTLQHGPWTAEVFDPRSDPTALGARYVHGGYIASCQYDSVMISSQAHPEWSPYEGCGFPEVFEWPLGFGYASPGEELMRIGAGRIRYDGSPGMPGSQAPLSSTVQWAVEELSSAELIMTTQDQIEYGSTALGYWLRRRVYLNENGLTSATTLKLHAPWNVPMAWFAHPFVPQERGDRTRFVFPEGATLMQPEPQPAREFRFPAEGGLMNVTGLWGSRDAVLVDCDTECCGGTLSISLDRPMDHLVLFATETAASPEPQLSRAWKNGETACWSIRYQWEQ